MAIAIEDELHKQLERLPRGQQQRVLDCAKSLVDETRRVGVGSALKPFGGLIPKDDLAIIKKGD